ncbi:hypothetical protein HPB47_018652 [Ixodes persulcatus]|uniref:Uncharacterized protein n=2 Tax=Ixodes persulcatus TaxID=34615 RepID=A0AC60QZT7_IXOPE|nr:hypothetical protein HPB47_018652 [Ixodes persulcatus]
MAAPLEPLSAQAGRKRFTIVEDVLLLREVLAMNPFVNFTRWDTVAANLNEALGRNFSVRGVRDRCDLLLDLFKRDDRTNLRSKRLAMEEHQIERRLAIEERQVTLSEDSLAFEKEKFYVLQEDAAEEKRHRLQLQEHYVQTPWTVDSAKSFLPGDGDVLGRPYSIRDSQRATQLR